MIEVQTVLMLTHDVGKLVWFFHRKDKLKYYHHCSSNILSDQEEVSWEGKVKVLENIVRKGQKESKEKLNELKEEQSQKLD